MIGRARWSQATGFFAVLLFVPRLFAIEPADHPDVIDCGTSALYVLLQWEGKPATWEAVGSRLGETSAAGHSMKELRDAARALGLELAGVRLAKGDRAPDRPAIAFVKRGPAGHFLAIRPVVTTGALLQVQDGDRETEIVDAAEFYARPGLTCLVLVPRPTSLASLVGRNHGYRRGRMVAESACAQDPEMIVVCQRMRTPSRTSSPDRCSTRG